MPNMTSILIHFHNLQDPGDPTFVLHSFHEILVIALCALLCGADDFVGMELYGKEREA